MPASTTLVTEKVTISSGDWWIVRPATDRWLFAGDAWMHAWHVARTEAEAIAWINS